MAIDPRISLMGQPSDMASAVMGGMKIGEDLRNRGVRDTILRQEKQVNQMNIAQAQGQYQYKLLSSLKSVPIEQRAALFAQQMPMLEQMGIQGMPDLSDRGIEQGMMATAPFMQQDQSKQNVPAEIQTFNYLNSIINDPNQPEQVRQAARVKLGTEARAVSLSKPVVRDVAGVPTLFTYRADGGVDTKALTTVEDIAEANAVVSGAKSGAAETAKIEAQVAGAPALTKVEVEKAEALGEVAVDVAGKTTAATTAATQAVTRESPEAKLKKVEGASVTYGAIDSINTILSSDKLPSITGFKGMTPTLLPETSDLINTLDQLNAVLTFENRDKLTGVLTDRDMDLLSKLASDLGIRKDETGKVIGISGSYNETIRKLGVLKTEFTSALNRNGFYLEGQVSSNPNTGQRLIYKSGQWVAL